MRPSPLRRPHAAALAAALAATLAATLAGAPAPAAAQGAALPGLLPEGQWATPAEASGYTRTPRYAETMAYFARLDLESADLRMLEFGMSPQGRPLQAVIVARGADALTPEAARASGKPVVLVQAAIHPGENEGKDALMAFARQLVLEGRHAEVLDGVVLVLVPIFNVDGHERFGPHQRANQNGPEEGGWRATATNLNLNRDYLKADAPEMQAWLRLWNRWSPHLLIDLHNTNGADYQYAMTWAWEREANLHPAVAAWQAAAFPGRVEPAMAARGWPMHRYVSLRDGSDLASGLEDGVSGPRFSVGYAAIANRAGLLVETHMLKDFAVRTRVNLDLLAEVLGDVARHGEALVDAVAEADAATAARAATPGATYPLAFELTDEAVERDFLGVEYTRTPSDVSGGTWIQYDPARPRTFRIPVYEQVRVSAEATPPAAYLVPAEWRAAIEALARHGVAMELLGRERTLEAGVQRFTDVAWAPRPFEGRLMVTTLAQREVRETATVPAGSALVRLDQPRANIAIHLLEPQAPDSLLRWGHFNAIFEDKEYAEPRVLEAWAREAMAADPALRAAFEARVAGDAAFAANPRARLRFFYERSPWFDPRLNRYPVLRLDAADLRRLEADGAR